MMDRYELDTVQQYMEGGMSQPDALAKFMRQRIDETPGDPEGAYIAILNRLEKLIGRDFVRGVCGMIAISRSGLRESDMEDAFKEWGTQFNPADFSWLRQMLRGHFSQGDMQQWDFAHQSLRRALRKDRAEELKRLNDGLVVHFRNVVEFDDFAVREIMHHLCVANRPDLAAEIISDNYENSESEFAQGLADVYTEQEGPAFLLAIPKSVNNVEKEKLWPIAECIGNCLPRLQENTRPFRIELMLTAIAMLEAQKDDWTLKAMAYACNNLASLYNEMSKTAEAGVYFQKALEVHKQLFDQSGTTDALSDLAVSYNNIGVYLEALGKEVEAGEYFQKALEGFKQIYDQSGTADALSDLSMAYNNIGTCLRALGKKVEAGEYFLKALEVRKHIYEQSETAYALSALSRSYNNMGNYLRDLGMIAESIEYY